MIEALSYSVTFSNGRTIARSLKPSPNGTTLIVGRNEAGKSLNLEMLAYALFGTDALRGAASEYSRIKVEATVVIKSVAYSIYRTKSDATLSDATGVLAKGTSPVNLRIQAILGFGLGVFRVSNWCAQGDIQALANMKPTERKQMIDEVSGLTQLDGVMAWVKQMAKSLKTSADAIIENLYIPTKPTLREGVPSKTELDTMANDVDLRKQHLRKLELLLSAKPTAPISPQKPYLGTLPSAPIAMELPTPPEAPAEFDYSLYGDWSETTINNCRPLIEAMPSWLNTKETLEKRVASLKAQYESGGVVTSEEPQLKTFEIAHEVNIRVAQKQKLQANGSIDCPNCGHNHYIAGELLKEFENVPDVAIEVPLTLTEIKAAYKQLERRQELKEATNELNEHLSGLPMPIVEYQNACAFVVAMDNHKSQLHNYKLSLGAHEAMVLRVQTNHQQAMVKWKQDAENVKTTNERMLTAYEDSLKVYDSARKAYEEKCQELKQLQDEYDALPSMVVLTAVTKELEAHREEYLRFETLTNKYEEDLERYNQTLARHTELDAKRESFELAGQALKEVKSRVKGYLVPSLSKVASQLLNQMTGGERCLVEISEDFEIMVDGQSLRTLSGSGKDITNLAIRIALGQVLTHKVMPLMMFDEIDAAMDDTRAEYTWDCIQKITPRIGQVLLVSHKDLTSTHRISV